MSDIERFYDEFADYYHLIFEDWKQEQAYQASVFAPLIKKLSGTEHPTVLDVTCGIGTQVLGLARNGCLVTGLDISARSILRASNEAKQDGLNIDFRVGDVRSAAAITNKKYDVVVSCDNSLPHLLTDCELLDALREMKKCVREGGGCIVTLRDYEKEPSEGTVFRPYGMRKSSDNDLIVFQVWEFDGLIYNLFWYFIYHMKKKSSPVTKVFKSQFYAVKIPTLLTLMEQAGFRNIKRNDEIFYQPVITAQA